MVSSILNPVLCLFIFSAYAFADCSTSNPDECASYTDSLNKEFSATAILRYRDGDSAVTSLFNKGHNTLRSFGVPLYKTHLELVDYPEREHKKVIISEYLRARMDGIPWHPFSFTVVQEHIEETYKDIIRDYESNILKGSETLDREQIMIGWLFSSLIPHSYNIDFINEIRVEADVLGDAHKPFWDIRVEIHQAPSLRTISRVEDYIKKYPSYATKAQSILTKLNILFGEGSLSSFLQSYDVESDIQTVLKASKSLMAEVKNDSHYDLKTNGFKNLIDLGQIARTHGEKIRKGGLSCSFGGDIDCKYEMIDLLKQVQSYSFVIGNELYSYLTTNKLELSIQEQLSLVRSFVEVTWSLGLSSFDIVDYIDEFEDKFSSSSFSQVEYENLLKRIEKSVLMTQQNIASTFGAEFDLFRPFVPTVNRFIDDTLRATTLLPMSNLVKSLVLSNQNASGKMIKIAGQDIKSNYRVLNPGVAKGKLYMPAEKDLLDPEMSYDSEGIYFLAKTPTELHKVAGVITADSGSVISHVQLLASNHGLPNIFITKKLSLELKSMEGQEIMIIALPNGEASIKLFSDATEEEKQAYRAYHKIKDKQKVTIKKPTWLGKYNYPLPLEKLRLVHSGKVAGGKACGLGELAATFPNTVPRGFVLPFGVYNDHILKNSAIKALIDRAFKDPLIKDDLEKRKAALKDVRDAIQKITLSNEIKDWITKTMNTSVFTDIKSGKQRGVFIRSDTNAEDLPGFVGAGLNETVANVTSLDELFAAIKKVWASPFKEKAISWRKDLIKNPWDVYPSVIVQLGINSDKAGVMIVGATDKKDDFEDSILIASNEGVGISVVSGKYNPEEVSYSRKEQKITRLRRAYAPKKLILKPKGGVGEIPSSSLTQIMTDDEIIKLSEMGHKMQEVLLQKKGKLMKWDIEWGYYKGKPIMFQIRPFIGNKIAKNLAALEELQTQDQIEDIFYNMQSDIIILEGDK